MGAERNEHANPVDTARPNVARMRDFLLNGKDNFAVDREEAQRLEAAFGLVQGKVSVPRQMALRDLAFVRRAVGYAAKQGAAQFAQLGAGLPAPAPHMRVHEAARALAPGAVFAAVSDDALVLSHTGALVPDVTAVTADFAKPDEVLDALAGLVDFTEPAALILASVLQFLPAAEARAVTAAYAEAMVPGSYLVVSIPRFDDPEQWERVRGGRSEDAAEVWNHTTEDVTSFFAGLGLVPPGLVPARGWQAEWGDFLGPDGTAFVLGGVGVKG
jgi:O-methyltransferase involved in polyketide biosynthesis